jgi:hypothetical protein
MPRLAGGNMANKKSNQPRSFISDPWLRYTVILILIYSFLASMRLYYSEIVTWPIISELNLDQTYDSFITEDDIELNKSFVEWFGVLYGFLLPLILVKVWEQFETLEKDFDKEGDSLKSFIEDVLLLPETLNGKKKNFLRTAIDYVKHVKSKYIDEGLETNNAKKDGNEILDKLRGEMSIFFSEDIDAILTTGENCGF